MGKTRRFVLLALIFALTLPLAGRVSAAGGGGEVVGYYASWAAGQGTGWRSLSARR